MCDRNNRIYSASGIIKKSIEIRESLCVWVVNEKGSWSGRVIQYYYYGTIVTEIYDFNRNDSKITPSPPPFPIPPYYDIIRQMYYIYIIIIIQDLEEKRTRLTTSRKERDKLVLWRIHVEQELINTAIIRATAPNSVQYLCRFPISGNIETADIANGNTQQLSSTMAATATPLV